ncbi:MAG TPA: hypothetical protein VK684_06865 [Edaphobacter sp.]|jgi:hypothetical protein|nr:hypothetical protein [Edaphobacter sp.]
MTSPIQVAIPFLRVAALLFFCATSARSQIRQINPTKLPQDNAVQHAYSDLLPIDQFARTSETTWRFPIPREQVSSRFLQALHTLEIAQKQAPNNKELQLLTGLVAHLAYNLGIEDTSGPAIELLQPQMSEDFRASWFLGMQQCQSGDSINGMRRLLHIESSTATLPSAFWQDYAICAGITNMPVHAVRAYDNARKANDGTPIDEQLEQIARDKIKPSSLTASYPARQAWYPERIARGNQVSSTLCGESFLTKSTSHLNIRDAGFGTCIITIDTEQYPSRYGPSSASLLVGTQAAKPGESLEAFAKRTFEAFSNAKLKDPGEVNRTSAGIQCPVATCLTFEVVTGKLYKGEGGAHLLAVFFQSEQPAYPGLRFETPQPTISPNSSQPGYLRPAGTLQRYSGTLYSFVTLDANLDIYPRSRADFDDLLKSIVLDSK